MDLELTDEQSWLAEAVETLLERHWVEPAAAWEAGDDATAQAWTHLVEFGALTTGPDGLGAIELCLVSRALGGRLVRLPFIGSAALHWALAPFADELPETVSAQLTGDESIALALLDSGRGWSGAPDAAAIFRGMLQGAKVAVEQAHAATLLAVAASVDDEPALVLVPRTAAGIEISMQPTFDPTTPLASVRFTDTPVRSGALLAGSAGAHVRARIETIGALLAAADAVGAAGALMSDACRYATERRQFGHTIASYQALRHLLAQMHVRQASSWSTVLYAAATLEDSPSDAEHTQTVSIAKAYVSRAAREVAHGALQVFGGIGFTAEHPAHRFLRRIVVRERQFGDARHHERRLGRALADRARRPALAGAQA